MPDTYTLPKTTPTIAVKVTTIETPAHTPTYLLGWLPIVWTRVLFAGPVAEITPWCWTPSVLIFVVSGVLLA